jgi:TPR repeat protein
MNTGIRLPAGLLIITWFLTTSPALGEVTLCDRLASHPSDPDRVTAGVQRADIDLAAAEAACHENIVTRPGSARARYQMGRVLYYQDKVEESLKHLEIAADIGYPQAIFVLGYLHVEGKAPRDPCKAARLWRRSAGLDHPWTGYYLVKHVLDGTFDDCDLELEHTDLERYLAIARDQLSVSESNGQVEALTERLAARRPAASSAGAPASR